MAQGAFCSTSSTLVLLRQPGVFSSYRPAARLAIPPSREKITVYGRLLNKHWCNLFPFCREHPHKWLGMLFPLPYAMLLAQLTYRVGFAMNSTKIAADTPSIISVIRVSKSPPHPEGHDIVLEGICADDVMAINTLEKMGYRSFEQHDCFVIPVGTIPRDEASAVYKVMLSMLPLVRDLLEKENTETFSKLVEVLIDRTPPTPALLMQSKMQARAINRVMDSGDWLTSQQVAEIADRSTTNPSAHTSKWKKQGQIFSIHHQGRDYYPGYALDPDHQYRPRPELKPILEIFGDRASGWELAFWFDSPNSYLGGQRPKELLATDPEKVRFAALMEAYPDLDAARP